MFDLIHRSLKLCQNSDLRYFGTEDYSEAPNCRIGTGASPFPNQIDLKLLLVGFGVSSCQRMAKTLVWASSSSLVLSDKLIWSNSISEQLVQPPKAHSTFEFNLSNSYFVLELFLWQFAAINFSNSCSFCAVTRLLRRLPFVIISKFELVLLAKLIYVLDHVITLQFAFSGFESVLPHGIYLQGLQPSLNWFYRLLNIHQLLWQSTAATHGGVNLLEAWWY